jgi:hypothetical protein
MKLIMLISILKGVTNNQSNTQITKKSIYISLNKFHKNKKKKILLYLSDLTVNII